MGIMEMAIASNELKHQKKAKNTDGKKTRSVRGIPKLMDAILLELKKVDYALFSCVREIQLKQGLYQVYPRMIEILWYLSTQG